MGILFKNPAFLYALSLIAIPIIIHLFNFKRYKTVYFSDVSFLESVKKKSKSTSQLKHLLVLFTRIFFIVSLVLIFAQPYIPQNNSTNKTITSNITIFIDNSFSSSNENTNGKILDIEKKKAISIASAFKNDTKFLLLTNDLQKNHNRFVDYEQLLDYILQVNITPKTIDINSVININNDFSPNINENNLYIISDFQNNFISEIKQPDSITKVSLIPVELSSFNNISIDSCWFETPNRKLNADEKLFVKIKSYSENENTEIPIKLFINDSLRAVKSFNIEPNETKTIELNYKNSLKGNYNGEIKIDDYPISFDNSLFFSYNIQDNINILIIEDNKNEYLQKLFETENYFNVKRQNINNITYSDIDKSDLVILDNITEFSSGLNEQLLEYFNNNGNIIFIPKIDNKYTENYNSLLNNFNLSFSKIDTTSQKIENLNTNSYILNDVFKKVPNKTALPRISKHFTIQQNNTEELIGFENGDLSVIKYVKNGNLYVFTFNSASKDNLSFIKSPIMLPLFFNIAFTSIKANKIYYNINDNNISLNYKLPANALISNKVKNIEFIPQVNYNQSISSVFIDNNITEAGNYNILDKNKIIDVLSFNYDRTESNMIFTNNKGLQKLIVENNLKNWQVINASNEHLTQKIKLSSEGKQLWYYFVILALIFITIEIILLRFFNKKNLPF